MSDTSRRALKIVCNWQTTFCTKMPPASFLISSRQIVQSICHRPRVSAMRRSRHELPTAQLHRMRAVWQHYRVSARKIDHTIVVAYSRSCTFSVTEDLWFQSQVRIQHTTTASSCRMAGVAMMNLVPLVGGVVAVRHNQ